MEKMKILDMEDDLLESFMIEIKEFLRVGFDEDDDSIFSLIIAAESYLENAGCLINYENFLFILAIKILVAHWYENREAVGNSNKLSYSLDNIITQLKYSYEVI